MAPIFWGAVSTANKKVAKDNNTTIKVIVMELKRFCSVSSALFSIFSRPCSHSSGEGFFKRVLIVTIRLASWKIKRIAIKKATYWEDEL